MRLSKSNWEKLLNRWSPVPDCGEKRLVCFAIASFIRDEPFRGGFWSDGFRAYCGAVHLNPDFVIGEIEHCNAVCRVDFEAA